MWDMIIGIGSMALGGMGCAHYFGWKTEKFDLKDYMVDYFGFGLLCFILFLAGLGFLIKGLGLASYFQ